MTSPVCGELEIRVDLKNGDSLHQVVLRTAGGIIMDAVMGLRPPAPLLVWAFTVRAHRCRVPEA